MNQLLLVSLLVLAIGAASSVADTTQQTTAAPADPCTPNPCANNGVCTAGAGTTFTCACPGNYDPKTLCSTVECSTDGKSRILTAGPLRSPSYPNNYPLGIDCLWTVEAPVNQTAVLDFGRFIVAGCQSNLSFNGSMSNDQTQFCGRDRPTHIVSTGTSLMIDFHSAKQQAFVCQFTKCAFTAQISFM